MYETLAMVRPQNDFTFDDMQGIVNEVIPHSSGNLESTSDTLQILFQKSFLRIVHNTAEHVRIESDDIHETFGINCAGSAQRFEIKGEDPGMDLFNDYAQIMDLLQRTGKLVLFDPVECTEL